jgi:hypothetical protein
MPVVFRHKKGFSRTAKIAVFEKREHTHNSKGDRRELVSALPKGNEQCERGPFQVLSFNDYIGIDVDIIGTSRGEHPKITKELQDGLKEDIEKHTGINCQRSQDNGIQYKRQRTSCLPHDIERVYGYVETFYDCCAANKGLFWGIVIGLAIAILFLTIGFWRTC